MSPDHGTDALKSSNEFKDCWWYRYLFELLELVSAREFGLLEAIVGVGTAMVVLERDDGETCCAVISLHSHCTGHHTADSQTLTVEGSPSSHFSQR